MCEACAQLHTRQRATKGHDINVDITYVEMRMLNLIITWRSFNNILTFMCLQ